MARASAQREYEVLVLNTNRSDKAKLVRLKGALVSMLSPGAFAGNIPICSNSKRGENQQDASARLAACIELPQCQRGRVDMPRKHKKRKCRGQTMTKAAHPGRWSAITHTLAEQTG